MKCIRCDNKVFKTYSVFCDDCFIGSKSYCQNPTCSDRLILKRTSEMIVYNNYKFCTKKCLDEFLDEGII